MVQIVPAQGVYFNDSVSQVFDTSNLRVTLLDLNAIYDNITDNLKATSNLTDTLGNPIAGESINFSMQFVSGDITDGWLPLSSAISDNNGLANISLALNDPFDKQFAVQACHMSSDNFSRSTATAIVQLASSTETLPSPLENIRNIHLQVSNSTPYASMPLNVSATYTSYSLLDLDLCNFVFYCDTMDSNGFLGSTSLLLVSQSPSLVYEAKLVTLLNVTGSHVLIGAVNEGGSIIAWANVTLAVQPCPSDVVIWFPDAAFGDTLYTHVGFGRPRLYEPYVTDWFTTTESGLEIQYDNETYLANEPVEGIPVTLFLNRSPVSNTTTDGSGTVLFEVQLRSSTPRFVIDVMAVVNETGLVYQGSDEQHLSMTIVAIGSPPDTSGNTVQFSCSINGKDMKSAQAYANVTNPVSMYSSLDGSSLLTNYSVLMGEPTDGAARRCTNSSGFGSVPPDAQVIQVTSLYDLATTTATSPSCDVDHDGVVSATDLARLANSYNKPLGDPNYDWLADINLARPEKYDWLSTLVSLAENYDLTVNYTSPGDYSNIQAVFSLSNGTTQATWLNWTGCFSIPPNATGFQLLINGSRSAGAVYECLKDVFHQVCEDSGNGANYTWVPHQATPYIAVVTIPPEFYVQNTGQLASATMVNDALTWSSLVNVANLPPT